MKQSKYIDKVKLNDSVKKDKSAVIANKLSKKERTLKKKDEVKKDKVIRKMIIKTTIIK